MQNVLREAKGSTGALYGYFPTKAELIRAAMAEGMSQLRDVVAVWPIAADTTLEEWLDAVAGGVDDPGREAEEPLFPLTLQAWAHAMGDAETAAFATSSHDALVRLWVMQLESAGVATDLAHPRAEAMGRMLRGYIVERALADARGRNDHGTTVSSS